ncbi:MAG: UDP-N-acetylmuramoyl-tripeptide--D-alanyl-D-alanine ligase, partial [Muribaculaceae bacterium]|nr:UDP-N-acetylmuramoyl-tripeptide--D-alanyl-D-alanine ligase [Muribaculaceae bacterium]
LMIVVYVICGIYMLLNFKHDIHMLQQNSYRISRYWKYLKTDVFSTWRLVDLALLFMIFAQMPGLRVSVPILTVVLVYKTWMILRKKFKKPLVMTKRVLRIFIVSSVLAVAGYLSVILATTSGTLHVFAYSAAQLSLGLLLLITIFSWVVVITAVILLMPVERLINRKYWNEASSILESMPDLTIIGITGSYGKTSTKHYLHRILSERFEVIMTPGSYNTTMGVIRTIREMMKPYDRIFICEMGAKQKGDIKEICDLVHPHIGIVTAIGPMHLESFKTMENVQSTKFELIDALPADGFAVVNNDFEYCANRKVENVETARYCVGKDSKKVCSYMADDIHYSRNGTRFVITCPDGKRLDFETKLVGACNISNLMAAVIVALRLGMDSMMIQRAVSRIEQVEHRLNIKQTPGGVTIIDDAFNSNPSGAKMALDVLADFKDGKRIVVTPGMIELGQRQAELNESFGEQISKSADLAIIVGHYNRDSIMRGIRKGEMKEDSIYEVDSFDEAQKVLSGILEKGDTILYENDLPDTFK